MDESSTDILEQAFLYASVLSLSPCTEDIEFDTPMQETEQTYPSYSNDNLDLELPRFDLKTQSLDCINLTKSYDIANLGEDIADIEINAFEDTANSDINQLQTTSGTAEVHSDSCSGMDNAVQGIEIIDCNCLQSQNTSSVDSSSSITEVGTKKKRRRKREKIPGPPPEPILPPCSICEEKSSGYHYGANTCEACKGFFGRTLKKKEIRYKCKCKPDEKVAWKRGPFKNGCPACRYKRCLDVGMSKKAIKIGRYTLVHKTKNIKKVKSIEAEDSSMTTLTHSQPGTSPSTSGIVDIVTPAQHSSECSNEAMLSLGDTHCKTPSLSPLDTSLPDLKRKSELFEKSSVSLCMSCITLEEIKSVVKMLTEAHTKLDFDKRMGITTDIIKKRQKDSLEKYRQKMEQFGSIPTLSNEEYQEFFNITGLDLDGRLEQIHAAFKFFEEHFRTVVAFAKAIPGFKNLPLDDQANLVKVSRVESTMIRVYKYLLRNVDMETRVFSTPWGTHLHIDEIQKWLPSDLLMERRRFGKQLLELDLTAEEESVIRAIITVSSDRCPLEQPQKVDAIQEKLITCLQYLLSIRQGGAGTLLYRIFSLLTNLRELTDKELDLSKRFFIDWPMLTVNNYQLLKEFVS